MPHHLRRPAALPLALACASACAPAPRAEPERTPAFRGYLAAIRTQGSLRLLVPSAGPEQLPRDVSPAEAERARAERFADSLGLRAERIAVSDRSRLLGLLDEGRSIPRSFCTRWVGAGARSPWPTTTSSTPSRTTTRTSNV